MPFIKAATIGTVCGVSIGAVYYILGGLAGYVLPSVNATVFGIIGFASALAISLLEDVKEK